MNGKYWLFYMMTKIVNIKGAGEVRFERSRRARRVSISVRPFQGVRVAVPYGISLKRAMEFVEVKTDWIKRNLEKMQRYEQRYQEDLRPDDEIDRKQARQVLTERLRQLADEYGYSYNRVFIRNQRTRWGSCSGRNNISLNIQLVRLPRELMDYVILHELVHTRIKHHGREFWAELDKLTGDGKRLATRLREYGPGIF
jgi:predicted metal-dependent hydrolase